MYLVRGAGKTHTILGHPEDPGLLQRSVDRLFEGVQGGSGRSLEVAALEVYNERLRDLLSDAPPKDRPDLKVVSC